MDLLTVITGLGNSVLLGGLSLILSVYLWFSGYRREPLALILGFIIPATIIGILKISFYVCNTNLWGIVSPSGHAAISLGVLGVCALILAKICTGLWQIMIPLFLVVLGIIIAVSRTILGMHTDGDVISGSLVGCGAVLAISQMVLENRTGGKAGAARRKKKAHPLVVCLLLLLVTFSCYKIGLPSERIMVSIAKQLRTSLMLCS